MALFKLLVFFRMMILGLFGFCICPENADPKSQEIVETIFQKLSDSSLDKTEIEKLGNQLIQLNKYIEATRFYTTAIEKDPSDPSYHVQRGRCFLKIGSFLFADHDFRDAIIIAEKRPDGRSTLNLNDAELAELGRGLFEQDFHLSADFWFTEAIKINPTKETYYRLRGNMHLKSQHLDLALSDYKNWVHLSDTNKNTEEEVLISNSNELETLGKYFFKKFRYEDAIWCCNQIIDRNASAESMYVLRAQCHIKQKNLDMAISDFRTVLQMNVHNLSAWYGLIEVMIEVGKKEEIIKETRVLSDSELMDLGRDFLNTRQRELALRFYTEAIKKNSSEASYFRERADCYVRMVRLNDAISDFKEALRIDPQNIENRISLIEILFRYKMFDKTVQDVLNDQDLMLLGDKFMHFGENRDALRFFTAAISMNPKNQLCYSQRGVCHSKLNNYVEAIEDLKKSLQLQPHNTSTRITLLKVLVEAEKYDEAAEVLNDLEAKNRDEHSLSSAELAEVKKARAEIEPKFEINVEKSNI